MPAPLGVAQYSACCPTALARSMDALVKKVKSHSLSAAPTPLVIATRLFTPTLQKSEGFRAKASKGAAVVDLLQALGNAGYEVVRLSRRVKKMA